METQRQQSDMANERSTLCLFGLDGVVVFVVQALHPDGAIAVQQASCYPKMHMTLRDGLAVVRRHCWSELSFQAPPVNPDICFVSRFDMLNLAHATCS
jgi:hypothetical protein